MIWAAVLLSVSSYSWYLVFAYKITAGYPVYWTGLAGLFLLSIVPTLLGFTFNRSLLASGPTILKLILINLLQYLLYAGLTSLFNIISRGYLFGNTPGPLQAAHLFPFFWQLLAWLGGLYFALKSDVIKANDQPANVKAVEISLALIIPGVFLLTFTGFPASLLITNISCWFIAMALTLAVGGGDFTGTSIIRYDIVFFHAIVPPLACIILFAAAFYGEVHVLLQAAQKAFFTFLGFIFNLLDSLLGQPPKPETPPPGVPSLPIPGGEVQKIQEPTPWLYLLFIAMGLLLLIPIVLGMIKLLKTRLTPVSPFPGRSFAIAGALLQMWRWVISLACVTIKLCIGVVDKIKSLAGKLRQMFNKTVRRWLPPRTPEHKIFRAYQSFLRLGRRAGCPRKASETPLEYAGRLQMSTGDGSYPGAEVRELTWLFLKARYSNKPISWQQAAEGDKLLKTIKHRLKN